MSKTPTERNTRSNSNSQDTQLLEIKRLIEAGNAEVVKALTRQVAQINENVAKLAEKFEKLEEKYEELEKKVARLSEEQRRGFSSMTHIDPEDMMQEAEERYKRRKYLIVSGVPEPSTCNVEERTEADETYIKRIADHLRVNDFDELTVLTSREDRLSKTSTSLFQMRDDRDKERISQEC